MECRRDSRVYTRLLFLAFCTVRVSATADIHKLGHDLLQEVQHVTDDRKVVTVMVESAMTDSSSEHKEKGETFKDALILLHQYLTNLDLIKVVSFFRSAKLELSSGVSHGLKATLKALQVFFLSQNELAETEIVVGRNQAEFAKKVKELQDNCRNERVIAANVVFVGDPDYLYTCKLSHNFNFN